MAEQDEIPEDQIPGKDPQLEDPDPVPPATINAAQYDYDGVTVVLLITLAGEEGNQAYALNGTDMNGLSPFLREELARMVSAGEIAIMAAPAYQGD